MKINLYRKLCLHLQESANAGVSDGLMWDKLRFVLIRQYHRLSKCPYLDIHKKTGVIYIHIPKTGGNSITRILYNRSSKHAGSHRAAWEYQCYDAKKYDSYYVFTMVRHPLSRMRSAFYYLKNGGMNAGDKAFGDTVLAPFATFSDLLRTMQKDPALKARVMGWIHFLPQSYYLCNPQGECIVPNILRIENFNADMRMLCDRLGILYTPRCDNPTPKHAMPEEDLSGAPEDFCYSLYRRDYELLKYSKSPESGESCHRAQVTGTSC